MANKTVELSYVSHVTCQVCEKQTATHKTRILAKTMTVYHCKWCNPINKPKTRVKQRKCLKCARAFRSLSPFNRICEGCKSLFRSDFESIELLDDHGGDFSHAFVLAAE